MDSHLILKETQELLSVHLTNRSSHWLAATLSALESCPLQIPEVVITHTDRVLPYLHAKVPEVPVLGTIRLKNDVKTGLLDFGCGLAIHLPGKGEPSLRLRFGDLIWLALTGSMNHQKNTGTPVWGTPSAETHDPGDGTPKNGKIAYGATLLNPIPESVLPESVQDTIRGFLHKTTGNEMKIGLLTDPIQKTQTLAVLTGQPIGGDFNPTPLLEALHWHCPAHYTWTALQNHEDAESLN